METEAAEEAAKWIKRAAKSTKPFYWYMVAKGADGEPALYTGRKLPGVKKIGKEARKEGRDRRFALGRLLPDSNGTLQFAVDEGSLATKTVSKALKMSLSKDTNFKKVRALLKKAVVLAGSDLESDEVSDDSDKQDAEEARDLAKAAYKDVKGEVSDDVLAQLDALRKAATKAFKADAFEESIELFDQLIELAKPVDDEGEAVDYDGLRDQWEEAWESTQKQILALQEKLRTYDDDELEEIAAVGLHGATEDHIVPFKAALLDLFRSTGTKQDKAFAKLAKVADRFAGHLERSPIVDAIDDNPFGVTCEVRKTLVPVLNAIAEA